MDTQLSRSRLLATLVLRGVVGMAVIDALLFGIAGRTDWRAAWVFTVMFATYITVPIATFDIRCIRR
jgi:hypothetical protein